MDSTTYKHLALNLDSDIIELSKHKPRRNNMTTITKQQAAKMIADYDENNFFSVKFIKRTNNEVRTMVCRKGVKKFTKGGTLSFSPKEKNLVCVWDTQVEDQTKAYRMIALENILEVKIGGFEYTVVG
jgi:hypothetical protein